MARECGTQKDFDDVIAELLDMGSDAMYAVAEDLIMMDYSRSVPFGAIFPRMGADGTCLFADPSVDNPKAGASKTFIAYLKQCNPLLDTTIFEAMQNTKDLGFQVPDIAMHRPIDSTFEIYEIKPNTPSQRSKGALKLLKIGVTLKSNPLTAKYDLGTKYSRRGECPFFTITKGVLLTEITLSWEPGQVDGLIVYKICIERRARVPSVATSAATNMLKAAAVLGAILIEMGAAGIPAF